jgi:glutamate synthase domain-containing protein 2
MMNEWGIPTFYLQSIAHRYAELMNWKGMRVPDIAIGGGFGDEANVFKAIAMGAPHVKAICMGRALMIPGFVGKNIGKWLEAGDLPKGVAKYGSTIPEIFVSYEELREKYGARLGEIPLGAVGVYTYAQRFRTGLQQLMAGSRNFSLETISRNDVFALTEDAAKVSGLPYVMEAYQDQALGILLDGYAPGLEAREPSRRPAAETGRAQVPVPLPGRRR